MATTKKTPAKKAPVAKKATAVSKAPAKKAAAVVEQDDARDASLRVSKRMRDSLKAAAAVMGRPLYDITNEAINNYLSELKLGDPLAAIRRGARGRR
ncbi:MAG: hypothetical protein ABIY56_00355 [Dokdonella sp.]